MNEQNSGYQLFMLGLSAFVVIALAVQTFADLSPDSIRILELADFAICFIFAFDFLRSLALADNRLRYMATWGWLDLLSSIPTIDIFRWGRAARVFRIIRILRLARAARGISLFAYSFRVKNALWAAMLLAIIVIVCGSVAILQLESHPQANINDADDALWWTMVTITTVGYGDYFPVTSEGKVLAFFLMATGIGLFGVLTAVIAAKFVEAEHDETQELLIEIREHVERLLRQSHRDSAEQSEDL